MENTKQRVVGYLHDQLSAGYTETVIREHLQKSGWSAEQIDKSFVLYREAYPLPPVAAPVTSEPAATGSPKARPARKKLLVAAAAVLVVVAGGGFFAKQILSAKPSQVYLSQQTADASAARAIASGVLHFRSNYGNLPKSAAVNTTPNVFMLCGDSCASSSSVLVNLPNYAFTTTDVKVKQYAANLPTPHAGSATIVTGAACTTDKSGITATADSAAVLYGIQDDQKLIPQCLAI